MPVTDSDRFAAPPQPERIAEAEALITAWLTNEREQNPTMEAAERDTSSDQVRWYVRVTGEQKAVFSIWFHLRQRSLLAETYLMPAPEENVAECFEFLMRRNAKLRGLVLCIGLEDAVYLQGELPVERVTEPELDRLLGALYEGVERTLRPAMRLGYASRFEG